MSERITLYAREVNGKRATDYTGIKLELEVDVDDLARAIVDAGLARWLASSVESMSEYVSGAGNGLTKGA